MKATHLTETPYHDLASSPLYHEAYMIGQQFNLLLEAEALTPAQIEQLFAAAEETMTSTGNNKTFLGKVGAGVGAVVDKVKGLGRLLQDTTLVRNMDQHFDDAKAKIAAKMGKSEGGAQVLQKLDHYRQFWEKYPVSGKFMYGLLTVLTGYASAGVTGPILLGATKTADDLLKNKSLSGSVGAGTMQGGAAAAMVGAKTAAGAAIDAATPVVNKIGQGISNLGQAAQAGANKLGSAISQGAQNFADTTKGLIPDASAADATTGGGGGTTTPPKPAVTGGETNPGGGGGTTPPKPAVTGGETQTIVAKKGDTMTGFADKYKVNPDELAKLNPDKFGPQGNPNILNPGDKIVLPKNIDAAAYKGAYQGDNAMTAQNIYNKMKAGQLGPDQGMAANRIATDATRAAMNEDQLDEGMASKLAAAALAFATSTGAYADKVYTYVDSAGKIKAVSSEKAIPVDAVKKFVVDTDTKKVTPISADNSSSGSAIGRSIAQVKPKAVEPMAAEPMAAEPNTPGELSKFSLKNGTIRFGMSEEDFKKISTEKFGDFGYVFNVADIKMLAKFEQGRLVNINTYPGPGNVMDFESIVSKKYGKPSKEERYVAGPNKGEVASMEWVVQDVIISIMPPRSNPTTGKLSDVSYGYITPKALIDKTNKAGEAKREKQTKEFEGFSKIKVTKGRGVLEGITVGYLAKSEMFDRATTLHKWALNESLGRSGRPLYLSERGLNTLFDNIEKLWERDFTEARRNNYGRETSTAMGQQAGRTGQTAQQFAQTSPRAAAAVATANPTSNDYRMQQPGDSMANKPAGSVQARQDLSRMFTPTGDEPADAAPTADTAPATPPQTNYTGQVGNKFMDKVEKGLSTAGAQIARGWNRGTTKVNKERLMRMWKDAGSPTDVDSVGQILARNGVPQEYIMSLFSTMGLPAPQNLTPAKTEFSDDDIIDAANAAMSGGPALTPAQKVRLDAIRKRQGLGPVNAPVADPSAAGGGGAAGGAAGGTAPGVTGGTAPGAVGGTAPGGSSGDGQITSATTTILPQLARMTGPAYADDLITIVDTALSVLQRSAPTAYREKMAQFRGTSTGKQREKAQDIITRTKKKKKPGAPAPATDTAAPPAELGPSRVIPGGGGEAPPVSRVAESRKVFGGKYIKESADAKIAREFEKFVLAME